MTLDHKISLKCQLFEIDIYTSSESWIKKLSIDVWFVMKGPYWAEIQLFENLESEAAKKFKFAQIKFLAMQSFDIFAVQNIFMEHDIYLIF